MTFDVEQFIGQIFGLTFALEKTLGKIFGLAFGLVEKQTFAQAYPWSPPKLKKSENSIFLKIWLSASSTYKSHLQVMKGLKCYLISQTSYTSGGEC